MNSAPQSVSPPEYHLVGQILSKYCTYLRTALLPVRHQETTTYSFLSSSTMAYHNVVPDEPPVIIPPRLLARSRHGFGLDSFSDDSDVEELSQLPAQRTLVPHSSASGQAGSQGSSSSRVIPIGSHTSGIKLWADANPGGDLPLYYSTNRSHRQRNTLKRSESRSGSHGSYSRTFNSDTGMPSNFDFHHLPPARLNTVIP